VLDCGSRTVIGPASRVRPCWFMSPRGGGCRRLPTRT
jgi:hypothetical protein